MGIRSFESERLLPFAFDKEEALYHVKRFSSGPEKLRIDIGGSWSFALTF